MKTVFSHPTPPLSSSVVTIGNFDGIHLGHARLIRRTVQEAKERGVPSVVLTFLPHPKAVLQQDSPPMLLTREDREARLAALGIDYLVYWPFSEALANMSPEEFVEEVLVRYFRPKAVCVGFNFTFGHQGKGTASTLVELGEKYGFNTWIEPPVTVDGITVSSSAVRQALGRGDILTARKLLGYWPYLRGQIVRGDRRGRQLGFPTANLELPRDIVCPAIGVYAAFVQVEASRFAAVLNIGRRPTFGDGLPLILEAHLLDYNGGDLYGQELTVEFRLRLREERRFCSPEELKIQLSEDVEKARSLLSQVAE